MLLFAVAYFVLYANGLYEYYSDNWLDKFTDDNILYNNYTKIIRITQRLLEDSTKTLWFRLTN